MTLILVQYLVRLEGDFSWQAQHIVTFWEIVAARNSVFYNTKSSPRSDRECPVRDDDFMLGSWSDDPRIVFLLAEALQAVSAEILSFKISWQAQYLVKLEGDFSWQAQHIVTFWEIAGARNVVIFNTKSSPRSDQQGLRSGGCEMTILSSDHARIMVGLSSNHLSIGGSTSGSFR